MGDVVSLSNTPIDLNTDTGHRFVVDCTRAGEGLLTDKELQEKYELSPADWKPSPRIWRSGARFGLNASGACSVGSQPGSRRPGISSRLRRSSRG